MKPLILFLLVVSPLLGFSQYGDKKFYLVDSLNLQTLPAQDKKIIDSLLHIFHTTKSDSVKLQVLYKTELIGDFNAYCKYKTYELRFVKPFINGQKKHRLSKKFLNKMYGDATYCAAYVYSEHNNEDSALYFAKQSLVYFTKNKDQKYMAMANTAIGNSYVRKGQIKQSLKLYQQALDLYEKIKSPKGIASCYTAIANVYRNIEEYDKAKEKFNKAFAIYKKENDLDAQAEILNLLGITYKWSGDTLKAEEFYTRSFELNKQLNNTFGIASARMNLGIILQNRKQYDKAIENYKTALEEFTSIQSINGISYTLNSLAVAYSEMGKPKEALVYAKKGYDLAIKMGYPENIMNASSEISNISESLGNYKDAFIFGKRYYKLHDSIQGVDAQKSALETQLKYEHDKKILGIKEKQFKKDILTREASQRQFIVIICVLICLALVILFSVYLYNRFRLIRKQKQTIEIQKHIVEEKNKEILDSIAYAKRLQDAILPPLKVVKEYLHDSFVLYKPKDIVAGDFYFMETLDNKVVFAAADCTGHGVPGAMVSVICSNALTRCVKEFRLTDPGQILDKTRELVLETFAKSESQVRDGMDISIACIDFTTAQLQWSGANNPAWIIRKENRGELMEIKPDKQPIGISEQNSPFFTHNLSLNKGDRLYIFTDGLADQFGGETGKKLKTANFKKLILEIQNLSVPDQKERINDLFETWQGNYEQVDDICLIGVEFN